VKTATIGIGTLANYSVWLKDCQHRVKLTSRRAIPVLAVPVTGRPLELIVDDAEG
jgi:hypothetical protein